MSCKRKPILFKNNIAARFKFAKLYLNKPQDFWPKWRCLIFTKHSTVHYGQIQDNPFILTVKQRVMIWACFVATAPLHLIVIESIMNSPV